ncbi:MAG: hypothetical protein HY619_02085 [Thaumarchaeota archaeon]|nr:hypothetical protein [Nitrososphaerota archaeon]
MNRYIFLLIQAIIMRQLEARPKNIESRIEKIEKELLVMKLALKKQKTKKIKLNKLVDEISSKAKPIETTSLIGKMRNKT